jgi:hypothetical protein
MHGALSSFVEVHRIYITSSLNVWAIVFYKTF